MALTKVSGGILDPGISVAGIITATGFDGPFTGGSSSSITAGIITATGLDVNGNGDISGNLVVGGNLTANGDFTTLNTTLREVELLRVDANSSAAAGIITQRGSGDILSVYDTSTEVFKIADGGAVTATGKLITSDTITTGIGYAHAGNAQLWVERDGINLSTEYSTEDQNTNAHICLAGENSHVRLQMGTEDVSPFSGWIQASYDNTPDSAGTGASGITGLKLNPQGGTVSTGAGLNVAGNIQAGGLTILDQQPKIYLTDNAGGTNDPDYLIQVDGGSFLIYDVTNTSNKILINADGHIDILPNTDFGAGIDVTGNSTFSNTATFSGHVRSTGTDGISIDTAGYAYLNFQTDRTNASDNIGGPIFKNASGTVVSRIQSFVDGQINIRTGTGNAPDYAFVAKPDGEVELYHNGTVKLTTQSSGVFITGALRLQGDNTGYINGQAQPLIYRTGSTSGSYPFDNFGHLVIQTRIDGSNRDIIFATGTNSANQIIINSSGHLVPGASGTYNLGSASAEWGDVYIADDKRLFFGSDQDFSIKHSGTNAFIDNDTGNLNIQSDNTYISNKSGGSIFAEFANGGASKLRYAGGEKLATSDTGITVTGEVAASQDYPNFRPTLDLNFAATKKLDSRITYQRTGPASFTDEFGKVVLVGDNAPRFDHDLTTGKSKGLLIEESRTNLFLYGTTPGDTWTGSKAGTFEENTTETTAPDGTFTATKWTFTTTDPYLYQTTTLNANTTYTMSMWVKAGTNMAGDWLQFRLGGAPYSTQGNSIIPADGTWRRISYTKTVGGSNETSASVGFEPQTSPSGNPASGDVIYIWGAQLEVGGFVTSFIPTNGSTATRGVDTVMIDGENFTEFYNPVESTILMDYTHDFVTSSQLGVSTRLYRFRAVGGNDTRIDYVSNSGYNPYIAKDGSAVASISHGQSTVFGGSVNRNAVRVKENSFAVSFNGSTVVEDTSGAWNPTNAITELSLGSNGSGGNSLNGHIQRFMYYPKGLPNSQLVTLTS